MRRGVPVSGRSGAGLFEQVRDEAAAVVLDDDADLDPLRAPIGWDRSDARVDGTAGFDVGVEERLG